MKIAFPYMGPVVAYKKVAELLGHEVIVPPRPTQKTIDLGAKHSPEFACFPYKVLMGSYIEACEMGADTIISSGGHGPCRAGFYGEVHDRTLERLGYDVDVIIFDAVMRNFKGFMEKFNKVRGDNSLFKVMRVLKLVYDTIHEMDRFDKQIHKIRPYEIRPGAVDRVWEKIKTEFDQIRSKKDLKTAVSRGEDLIADIDLRQVEERNRIRVGIVGEIYVVMESSINMEIEKVLNNLGCETERSQYLSEWVDYHGNIPFRGGHEQEAWDKGEEYIEIGIGGHAKQTVGHIVNYKDRGYDGVIHLMPFACLPELVSQSIIPKISKEHDIPVMTLSLDEQSGAANNQTRIEAFVDLIKNKKLNRFSA